MRDRVRWMTQHGLVYYLDIYERLRLGWAIQAAAQRQREMAVARRRRELAVALSSRPVPQMGMLAVAVGVAGLAVVALSLVGCAAELPHVVASVKQGEHLEVTVSAAPDDAALAAWRKRRDELAAALNLQGCAEPAPGEWTIRTMPAPSAAPSAEGVEPPKGTMVVSAPMRCGGQG